MRKISVGLLGCGVVGSAVVRSLHEDADRIAARCGAEFEVKKIAVRETGKNRSLPLDPKGLITDSVDEVVCAPDIDMVVELMGGEDAAYEAITKAIGNGKHVVTANKLVLAKRGEEIFKAAGDAGVELGFEASVAGGVPVIRTIKEAVASGGIKSVFGIINGTANYILTQMTKKSESFNDALEEAKRLGYAEADPAFDVGGIDAAHKITILANLAFGTPIDFESVYVEGIQEISPDDIYFAKQFGRVIKLLATARIESGQVDVRVHPAMVPEISPMAHINGVTNAVELVVGGAGRLMLIGAGAGGEPTASSVIADMVEIARNIESGSVGRVSPFAFMKDARRKLPMKPIEEIISGYYLRFSVFDKPGVLAEMSGILGKRGISIASVIQKGRSHGSVPLVILTHEAREKELRLAVKELDKLESTKEKTKIIRLENGEEDDENGR